MHRIAAPAAALALGCLVAAGTATTAAAASSQPSLSSRVQHAVSGSTAKHADYVFQLSNGVRIARHATTMTAPASTEKLFTTVTLLQEAGPSYEYATTVSGTTPVVNHVLHGDLVITGSGDPSLTSADLRSLAHRLHANGLHKVTGHLVVDDSRYTGGTMAPGWKHDFVPEETGPVDAFTVDRNEWRGGASFDRDPSYDNGVRWRSILRKAHISVSGKPRVGKPKVPTFALATHHSGPLSEIVDQTLTVSDNFYAEMMLREAGALHGGRGSRTGGIAAVKAEASRLGVRIGTIHDGSGLSYDDRQSPNTLLDWLSAVRHSSLYSVVRAALPISCRTGTLEYRLCGAHLTGVVHAKTGTLNYVNTLAGWARTASGHDVTFAVMLAGEHKPTKALSHLDSAVAAVIRHG